MDNYSNFYYRGRKKYRGGGIYSGGSLYAPGVDAGGRSGGGWGGTRGLRDRAGGRGRGPGPEPPGGETERAVPRGDGGYRPG